MDTLCGRQVVMFWGKTHEEVRAYIVDSFGFRGSFALCTSDSQVQVGNLVGDLRRCKGGRFMLWTFVDMHTKYCAD
jgi:hypothetical protein